MQKGGTGEVALKGAFFMRNASEDLSETEEQAEEVIWKNHEINGVNCPEQREFIQEFQKNASMNFIYFGD